MEDAVKQSVSKEAGSSNTQTTYQQEIIYMSPCFNKHKTSACVQPSVIALGAEEQ